MMATRLRLAAPFLAFLLAACDPGGSAKTPMLDPILWEAFQARFVSDGRVVDRDNGGISHSEGQGYGMLLAEAAGDRDAFDRLWAWTRDTLRRDDGLLSWRWEPGRGITDRNNATDGEILVAWALLRAASRWDEGGYRDAGIELVRAIRRHALLEHGDGLYILPGVEGFATPDGPVLNPSYWVFPALADFAAVDAPETWARVSESGLDLIAAAGMGPRRLAPDWVLLTAAGPVPAPDFPPRFAWNAVRVPLNLAWEPPPRRELLAPYVRFWTAGAEPPPAWVDVVTGDAAQYPVSTGIAAVARVAEAALEGTPAPPLPEPGDDDGYFSSSLALLARLAAAGKAGT